jgi:site-specific DNA recombinase
MSKGEGAERIALYMRVSSEEQVERMSIGTQEEFLDQYCALYGHEVADVYKDEAISGTVPMHERPEGRRLLDNAKTGAFGTVLVYRLDRVGRSLLVVVDAHDRLGESGIALKSANEPIDTSTPAGRLIFQMLASFAEFERGTIRERTRHGLHRAFRKGKHSGRIPYGYKLTPDESGLEVVEEETAVVRQILANVAGGSTLYGESKRLNDEGVPSPGWRFKSGERKYGVAWSPSTIATIVHQSAYSGVHRVKADKGYIEREVPPIVESGLQKRAEAALQANRHRASAQRKAARKYLLSGLVTCGICGYACSGHTSTRRGKKYPYYGCMSSNRPELGTHSAQPHYAPRTSAPWLEDLVWSDVKMFVTNPGEVLERVREQLQDEVNTEDLSARLKGFEKRLVAKQGEKDRYVRLYAQGHISEGELETYLADLKNQIGNLRLLIDATEADLSRRRERVQEADTTVAWLNLLRERAEEIEEDTPEAFVKRQQLVRLLVDRIALHRGEGRKTTVMITYRFGPPDGRAEVGAGVVGNERNSEEFPKERKKP